MIRRNFLKNLGLFSASAAVPVKGLWANSMNVKNSMNVSGKVKDQQGKPLKDVSVSDGFSVVRTDRLGYYQLPTHPRARFVFISIPSGFEFPNKNGIAHFYEEIDKNASGQKIDFTLNKLGLEDNRHAFIVWADPQIQSAADAAQLKTVSAPDTKAEITRIGNVPLHGIGCGDLVFDHPELNADYKEAVAITGIPFFQLIGNHDEDYSARTDDYSQDTFMSNYGPVNYSYNRGKIHYVSLDNVFFVGQGHRYIGYLPEDTLEWLEQDLSYVPEGSTVVVSLHIPSNTGDARRNRQTEDSIGGVTMNRDALYKILKPYKVHLISGHTHWNENWEKDNMMEHDLGTLCGAWWTGPVCGDGTPSGYMVFEADGEKLSWYYKSTGFDKSHQLVIHKEGAVPERPDAVLANVWNVDRSWKVEWWEGNTYKGPMEQFTGYDPVAYQLYQGPQIPKKHKWVEPVLTDHLYVAVPSDKVLDITVKATDRFGNVYQQILKR